jgi:hypothetical protein
MGFHHDADMPRLCVPSCCWLRGDQQPQVGGPASWTGINMPWLAGSTLSTSSYAAHQGQHGLQPEGGR